MKKLLLVLLVLGAAAAIGYVLGTEQGRQRRDRAVARFRGAGSDASAAASDAVADLTDAGTNVAEQPEVAGI
ncbi:MAG: hypothetical protein OES57_02635 [Acidimicrobiia bacterium]|nr:hypothetical protein [Acidimicrobiia bacterium]